VATETARRFITRHSRKLSVLAFLSFNLVMGADAVPLLPPIKKPADLRIEYPPSSWRAGEEGSAVISFGIEATGKTRNVEIVSATFQRLGQAAQGHFRHTLFDVPPDWDTSGGADRSFQLTVYFKLGSCEDSNRYVAAKSQVFVCAERIGPRKPGPECSSLDAIHALQIAKARWQRAGLRSYGYTVSHGAMYRFTDWPESNGVHVRYRQGELKSPKPAFMKKYANYLSIEGLFERIADEAAGSPDCLQAIFDPVLGYPTSIFLDPDLNISDNYLRITVSEFRADP
jgi:TonB family protein